MNQKRTKKYFIQYISILVSIVSIFGCTSGSTTTSESAPTFTISEVNGQLKNFKLAGYLKPPPNMSVEEFDKETQRLFIEYMNKVEYQNHEKMFYQQLRSAKNLGQIHRITQEYFRWVETLPLMLVLYKEQMASQSVLRTYFLDAPITVENQQAIEYYVELLIKHRLWVATELYAPALLSLRGYWTEEKIAQTAQTLIKNRFPTFNTQSDFLAPSAWSALKSGYSKQEADINVSAQKDSKYGFDQASMQKTTAALAEEYKDYIRFYPKKQLPQIPRVDKKGVEIVFVDEMQGLAVLALLAKIQ